MYQSSDLMIKIFSGNKKYIFSPRFQLHVRTGVCVYMDATLLLPQMKDTPHQWGLCPLLFPKRSVGLFLHVNN